MSATNRGVIRKTNDDYPTPDWLIAAMLAHLRRPRRILEPAAGAGAIVRALEQAFPGAEIISGDITQGQDFLTHDYDGKFDLIMTNPLYCLALPFLKRALELRAPLGVVVMLLRLNFLGSQRRAAWFRDHRPSGIYLTPRRPCFVGKRSDNCEYTWLVWDDYPFRLELLPTEQLKSERRRGGGKGKARSCSREPANGAHLTNSPIA
jgi:hypothetical protein